VIARLLGPSRPEVTCEECFELLDAYVDLQLAGENADAHLPGIREHLQGCPACHEDHESLRDLVAQG
jgi:predicted anti-sigma-YlaC factor YlaD